MDSHKSELIAIHPCIRTQIPYWRVMTYNLLRNQHSVCTGTVKSSEWHFYRVLQKDQRYKFIWINSLWIDLIRLKYAHYIHNHSLHMWPVNTCMQHPAPGSCRLKTDLFQIDIYSPDTCVSMCYFVLTLFSVNVSWLYIKLRLKRLLLLWKKRHFTDFASMKYNLIWGRLRGLDVQVALHSTLVNLNFRHKIHQI